MVSQANSLADSDDQNDSNHELSEMDVPELDHDASTDEFTSDHLSTRTTSIMGMDHRLVEADDGYGNAHFDAASIHPSSHYPAFSIMYQTDRPWEEAETIDSTRSITELDLDYVWENGRRYCRSYFMPNDDDEQVRLQLINQVYLKAFEGELTSVPLECPSYILDIGTAVGDWAIDMAEAYPECEVTGTDISNIFERRVPQNVYWEVDNAELDWERPSDYYDLVHLRSMAGAFSDWEFIYRSAYTCLKPGGWVEVLDFDDHKAMANLLSLFENNSLIHKLRQDVMDASVASGRPLGIGHLEPRYLVNAGYIDVQLSEHAIPLRTQDGSSGKFWLLGMLNGLEAFCMRLLTRYKGWSPEDVRTACEACGEELMAMALNARRARNFVVKLRVMIGKKPGHHLRWSTAPISESGEVMKRSPEETMSMAEGIPEIDVESGYGSYGRQRFASDADLQFFGFRDESPPTTECMARLSGLKSPEEQSVSKSHDFRQLGTVPESSDGDFGNLCADVNHRDHAAILDEDGDIPMEDIILQPLKTRRATAAPTDRCTEDKDERMGDMKASTTEPGHTEPVTTKAGTETKKTKGDLPSIRPTRQSLALDSELLLAAARPRTTTI